MFEIAKLICTDITEQIEDAELDERHGHHQASLHRCKTAKNFCENLIDLLDEIIEKEAKQ